MDKERTQGFTLIEVMLTIALLAVLFALIFINLGKPQTTASLSGAVDTLVADISGQQMLAMSGDSGSGSSQEPHGVLIESDKYTLFAGETFSSSDIYNYTVETRRGVSLSTTLPDSQIIFNKGSGEVHGFSDGSNSITVEADNESKTITINRFGTVTVE